MENTNSQCIVGQSPDVVNWYAATRMTPFVEAGLFRDISDLWDEPEFSALASTEGAMTLNDAQWGALYLLSVGRILSQRYI